jgi:bacillithiol system protein YtxJ
LAKKKESAQMGNMFLTMDDKEVFENLISSSQNHPVIIFKHSTSCPISAAAYREMKNVDAEVSLVEVQSAREVSREIANRTGVRHESPQVIVLRNGKAVWNASHFDVTATAVAEAVQAHS